MVNAQNGRRGGSLSYMVKTASPVSLYQAQSVYNKLVDSKKAKGYTENPNGVPYAQPDPFTRRRSVAAAVSTPVPPPMAVKAPAVKEDGNRAFSAMLLNPITEEEAQAYIDDDGYMAQEKKNGRRISVLNGEGEIQGFNKLGKARPLPIEIANELPKGLKIQIDTEMIGNVLWAFDLLSMGGLDFKDSTTLERYETLSSLNLNSPHIKTVETAFTKAQKQKMFNRLKAENAEGIVFKLKSSRYVGGRPASGGPHIKCKFYHEASVLVTKVNAKRSVAIAVLDDNSTHIKLGNVTIPPNKEIPAKGAVIEVRYLTCLKGGSLYQPTFKEDRSDEIDETSCIESQIVYTEEIE
jgi:bifunctional non-homologous end joining protein LigD